MFRKYLNQTSSTGQDRDSAVHVPYHFQHHSHFRAPAIFKPILWSRKGFKDWSFRNSHFPRKKTCSDAAKSTSVQLYWAVVLTVQEWTETGLMYKCTAVELIQAQCVHHECTVTAIKCHTGVHRLDNNLTVQLLQAKCVVFKRQHN